MPITPHAKWRTSSKAELRILSQFAMILVVVWSANGEATVSALTSKASSNLLHDDT